MESKKLFSKKKLKEKEVLLSTSATRDSVGDVKIDLTFAGLE